MVHAQPGSRQPAFTPFNPFPSPSHPLHHLHPPFSPRILDLFPSGQAAAARRRGGLSPRCSVLLLRCRPRNAGASRGDNESLAVPLDLRVVRLGRESRTAGIQGQGVRRGVAGPRADLRAGLAGVLRRLRRRRRRRADPLHQQRGACGAGPSEQAGLALPVRPGGGRGRRGAHRADRREQREPSRPEAVQLRQRRRAAVPRRWQRREQRVRDDRGPASRVGGFGRVRGGRGRPERLPGVRVPAEDRAQLPRAGLQRGQQARDRVREGAREPVLLRLRPGALLPEHQGVQLAVPAVRDGGHGQRRLLGGPAPPRLRLREQVGPLLRHEGGGVRRGGLPLQGAREPRLRSNSSPPRPEPPRELRRPGRAGAPLGREAPRRRTADAHRGARRPIGQPSANHRRRLLPLALLVHRHAARRRGRDGRVGRDGRGQGHLPRDGPAAL